ncbi:MAG: thiamine pyrophosphate-dependent enzyme [Planctomycetota bacterium]
MTRPRYETYLSTETIPLPYCPGCGHKTLVTALDKALVLLQLDPKQVVIVTDIGCIGLADRNFTTSGFHGLHGRSITYACGLKLARPELTVITLKGDGACGIGGTHLLNVARRNIGISLIVANNFNYGMTGGQHSVTTPTHGITSTTPWGNVERPMDLCATTKAAGAAWVYRATVFDKNLPEVLAEAIRQPGFAMVDVVELCMAYYAKRNEMHKAELLKLLAELDFKLGCIVDEPRPEYSTSYREAYEAGKSVVKSREKIKPSFTANVRRQTGVILAGSAGQKIRSSATLLAEGAIASGLYATQKDDYPITVMTGHSVAEIIVSPEPIDYTGIDTPDYLVALSQDGVKRTAARIKKAAETCTVYADEALELPETRARVVRLPFAKTAAAHDRLSVGIVALGAMLQETGMFPNEAMASIISSSQKPTMAEVNLRALASGAALLRRS